MTMHHTARPRRLDRTNGFEEARSLTDGGTIPATNIDISDLETTHPGSQKDIGGVILAAGTGERFEGPYKLLVDVEGEPLVRRAVEPFLDSCIGDVILVVGHEEKAVRDAVSDWDVTILTNEAYRDGQSTSLHRGVELARERDWEAILYGLGDMPDVSASTIDALVQAYLETHGSIVAPAYRGKRGNPALFDSMYFEDLLAVTGDTGGRPVLQSSSDVAVLETGDPGVLRDINKRSDL